MNAADDTDLLRRYAEEKSEAAFAELVQRHVNVVYACALRRVGGDAHLAEDVTQVVFTGLARDAASLCRRPVLIGWLFTATRFASAQVVRTERRRHAREHEAHLMDELTSDPRTNAEWERLRPVLDDALDHLSESDREAILLRFFEGRDYARIGARLHLSDNTARMRVERALDKLRVVLERRGVTSTSAALATALAHQAVFAAPAGLAANVSVAAIASGATVSAGSAAAIFMGMTKLQLSVTGALAVSTVAGFVAQSQTQADLRAEMDALRAETQPIAALKTENAQLARTVGEANSLRVSETARAELQKETEVLRQRLTAANTPRLAVASPPSEKPRAQLSGPVYDIATVDVRPKPKFQARPSYPAELRAAGINGDVVVDFVVDENGEVQKAFAQRSSQREFEAPAVEAVSKWKFDPGQKAGAAVNTHLQIPIVFTTNPSTADKKQAPQPTFWF